MHALSSDRAEAKMHTGEKTFGPMHRHTGESGQKEEEEQDLKSELSHLHWASTIWPYYSSWFGAPGGSLNPLKVQWFHRSPNECFHIDD